MANAWLEMRSCDDDEGQPRDLDPETVSRFPALSDAFSVAEVTASDLRRRGGGQEWEYSVRLAEEEIIEISVLFLRGVEKDEGQAIRRTIDVRYNGRCYAISLFVFKQ